MLRQRRGHFLDFVETCKHSRSVGRAGGPRLRGRDQCCKTYFAVIRLPLQLRQDFNAFLEAQNKLSSVDDVACVAHPHVRQTIQLILV